MSCHVSGAGARPEMLEVPDEITLKLIKQYMRTLNVAVNYLIKLVEAQG